MRSSKDTYANIMSAKVTTAGASAEYVEVLTGVSIGEGKGILIDQIDYFCSSGVLTDLAAGASGDNVQMAWLLSSPTGADDFLYTNNKLLHQETIHRIDFGVAASGFAIKFPHSHQFFPPMIFASPRIYLSCYAAAAVAGGVISSRLYFRYVDLSDKEYLELAESFSLTG